MKIGVSGVMPFTRPVLVTEAASGERRYSSGFRVGRGHDRTQAL